jgi:predicted nucleic acid-binding Zn ribbon protein
MGGCEMKCPHCGAKVSQSDNVCPACKRPLIGKERFWRRKTIAIILSSVLVIIVVVVISFAPLKRVSYTVMEQYQTTETYYVTEPYTVQEPYTELEPYTTQEPYTSSVSKNSILFSGQLVTVPLGSIQELSTYIDISNKINTRIEGNVRAISGGEFIFRIYDDRGYRYIDLGGVTNYYFSISPVWTGRYYFQFDNTLSFVTTKYVRLEATYYWQEIVTEYRTVTQYREVTKYKEVTKYREVSKQRIVWKEKPVTYFKDVSLLEYWLSY